MPPTAGFVSKWYIIAGAFQVESYFTLAVLMISTGLNAAYFLPIVFRAFFRPEDQAPPSDHGEGALADGGRIDHHRIAGAGLFSS